MRTEGRAGGREGGRKDSRTDMTNLIAAFSNLANVPNNSTVALLLCFLSRKLLLLASRVAVQSRAQVPLCNIWNCHCGDSTV